MTPPTKKGLAMAGLNFVGNAFYRDDIDCRDNVAQFEFVPWILCQCANVTEARSLIEKINITTKLSSARKCRQVSSTG